MRLNQHPLNYFIVGAIFALVLVLGAAFISVAFGAERGLFLELGAGFDSHIDEGTNPRGIFRLRGVVAADRWQKGDAVILEYDHHSSIRDGKPFNDRPEDMTNQWSVIYSVPLWKP